MTTDFTILKELQELSPTVAKVPRQCPYAVPVGYFEEFSARILGLAKTHPNAKAELEELSPLLAAIPKNNPFSLPQGYFDATPADISAGLSGILQARQVLDGLPPELEALKTVNPYQTPQGYFEQLPEKMLQLARTNQPAQTDNPKAIVRGMGSRWIRYAAAAVVTGVVAFGAWLYFQPSPGPQGTNSLAAQLEKEMSQLSDEAIQEYTSSASTLYYGTASNGNAELSDADVHYLLGDVSDEALQQYLTEQAGKTGSNNN